MIACCSLQAAILSLAASSASFAQICKFSQHLFPQLARLSHRNASLRGMRPVVESYQSVLREAVSLRTDVSRERHTTARLRDEVRTLKQHLSVVSEAAKASIHPPGAKHLTPTPSRPPALPAGDSAASPLGSRASSTLSPPAAAQNASRVQELEAKVAVLQEDLLTAYKDKSQQAENLLTARSEIETLTRQLR